MIQLFKLILFSQKIKTIHSFCDYLTELQTQCFPLYSSCYPDKALQVMLGVWVRQELKNSLSVLPRNQFFHCNTTKEILHEKELDAMKEMVKVMNSIYAMLGDEDGGRSQKLNDMVCLI